jgi:putative dehydrogenase
MNIGIVGVGNMGGPMARRLLDGGASVAVRDVVPARERALAQAGASVCASPAALAAACDTVIVAVVDAAQTVDVLFGADGVVHGARHGACVLLCATIGPADVEQAARRLSERSIDCIDAPMSGGPARARDGSMSLTVACDDAVFERHAALLQRLASRLVRVGTRIGDGARTKLVNNLLAAVNLAGAAEALALAGRLGLDPARTLDMIEKSSGQSWIGSDRLRRALARDFMPRAQTTMLRKDSALALAMAREAGVATPLGEAAAALFARACDAGCADLDDASLYDWLRGD